MSNPLKQIAECELHTAATPPGDELLASEPHAAGRTVDTGAECLIGKVSDSSGVENEVLHMNSTDLARIRTLTQELLALVGKLEAAAASILPQPAAQEDFDDDEDDENDTPPVAPFKPRSYAPVRRPGGIYRTSEILLTLDKPGPGVTPSELARMVLTSGETNGKSHYRATYAALKKLAVWGQVEQRGPLWFLTERGREVAADYGRWMAENTAFQARLDAQEPGTSSREET